MFSYKSYYFIICLLISISLFFCIFIPIFSPYVSTNSIDSNAFFLNGPLIWPTPGYTIITSPFGNRYAPTAGASSFHSGIDIGAPTGCNIVAVCPGIVTFLGFNGAGGFTITIKNSTFSISYCHVSPEYQVYIGQNVKQGQVIGKVGPEYVYGVIDNPYTDESGNPTNGATTGPHLHLTIRKDDELVNPLDYFSI